jgi:hypothetical protein
MRALTTKAVPAVSPLITIWPALSQDITTENVDPTSRIFAAAQTAKQQCLSTCRARYRDCRHLNQLPPSECRGFIRTAHDTLVLV